MKRLITLALLVFVALAGCGKYDDSDLRQQLANLEKRTAALETLTKSLGDRLDAGAMVTGITALTGDPGGWRITFTKGDPIEIRNGAKGDAGAKGDTGGKGDKGDKGDAGAPGESLLKGIVENSDGTVTINLVDGRSFTFTKDPGYNKFTVNGTERKATATNSVMYYYGSDMYSESVYIGVSGVDDKFVIRLDMRVPFGNDRLVAGEYTFAKTYAPYTLSGGATPGADNNALYITGGTAKVSVEGTGDAVVYTIEVDCTLQDNGTIKGIYRGTLEWSDDR